MGGASPYRARFIGPPAGSQSGQGGEGVPCDNGEKYFGLVNVANTCYVNSVLQALYFCTPFRKSAIRHLHEDRDEDSNSDSLLTSLAELFAQIEGQKRTVGCITPRRFLAKVRKANDLFCTSEHQDAHEFMQFLLNDLVESVKKRVLKQREREKEKLKQQTQEKQQGSQPRVALAGGYPQEEEQPEEEPRTWIHDIFQGYLVNQMKCLCCENVTVRKETFLDLSVDIERHTSIAACLRAFESTELLRAGNKFFCDTCGCLQEAEKRLRIYQLPSVLTLHLKRFKYVDRLGRCIRLQYRVVFPLQLRVVEHRPPRRHMQQPGASTGEAGGASIDGEDAASSSAAQPPSRLFELRSVVVHIGRDAGRGHYVTVVRNGDRCVLLDDDVVRVVEPEVLRSFYGNANPHGNSNARNNFNQDRGHHASGGWGSSDAGDGLGNGRSNAGGDRFPSHASSSAPLYERSPEGTCCGYLLFYEAVDGIPDHDSTPVVDVGAAADWISEDGNLTDSDSQQSEDDHAGAGVQDRHHPNACDDGELTQAFEQRCIPRGPATRAQYGGLGGGSSAAAVAELRRGGGVPAGGTLGAGGHGGLGGGGGAFAWAAAEGEDPAAHAANADRAGIVGAPGAGPSSGERERLGTVGAPAAMPQVRTLGSVVPAADARARTAMSATADTVSPSRVNVVTVPSPSGSMQGVIGGEADRGK